MTKENKKNKHTDSKYGIGEDFISEAICEEAGLRIVSISEFQKKENEAIQQQNPGIINFRLPHCRGDIEKCPQPCGFCAIAGRKPGVAIPLGKNLNREQFFVFYE